MKLKKVKEKEFENMINRNSATIYKVCRFYYNDVNDIQDLFQEITIRLWKGYNNFRKESKESTWVYRVSINTAINFKIKDKRNIKVIDIPSSFIETIKEQEQNEQNELIKQLYKLIEDLNVIDKTIILLYLDNKTYKEISEIVGLSSTNIGTKIQRIKEKMKQQVNN